jgi:hypothetical protein
VFITWCYLSPRSRPFYQHFFLHISYMQTLNAIKKEQVFIPYWAIRELDFE